MNAIKVMVNGLPGNMARTVAEHVVCDKRFQLIPYSLTGPEIAQPVDRVKDVEVRLTPPADADVLIAGLIRREGSFISVDYTHPSAVNHNAEFYCRNGMPFVMGTTGGDRNQLEETVKRSTISAVIAPNMAKPIIGFTAMMEYAANNFPGLFEGYALTIRESHQQGKADTSGTAAAMVRHFNAMGIAFSVEDIQMERDPIIQKDQWKIPEKHLGGHAWHTYTLVSDDQTVKLEFSHNVNGRDVYAKGTLDAVLFLEQKIRAGITGTVFHTIDVLKKC
jgi:4-hydroxy-tetrahydrodipicolinate reductase